MQWLVLRKPDVRFFPGASYMPGLLVALFAQFCAAQTIAPVNLPQPDAPATTLHVNTSVVLVPTLVEKSSGEMLYGLTAKDFAVEDNGVPQDVHVDDDLDTQPVSIVVAIEKGRTSLLQFQKFSHLGPLLELFMGGGHGEAALVTFDSLPELAQDFTPDSDVITGRLQRLQPGDGGAAILDTVGYCVNLLEERPRDRRRVLLLVSESRDHGSHIMNERQLVERIGETNTLVLSVTYSASKAEFFNDLKGGGSVGPTMNMLSPLMMAVAAMHKNVARQLAVMSGGEYAAFTKERGLEDSIAESARHARNRYMLTFRPKDLTPGLHQLRVRLTADYGAHVVARSSYWAVDEAAAAGP